jgi:DNA-binding transcriptional LysR family regulator
MDFDFPQIEALVSIVNHGSFSAAARFLHLSQSALSERIANLETAIGARLLDRGRRQTRPTAIGRHLYDRGTALLQQRARTCTELSELLGVQRGTLCIGASTIPGEFILPRVLARFTRQHPGAQLTVRIGDSATIADGVEQGRHEIGVIGARISGNRLLFEPLWRDRLAIVVPAGHRWERRRKLGLDELASEPFLMREQGSGTRRRIEEALPKETLETLDVVVELGSTNAVKEGILHGLGVSILSERAVRTEVRTGTLVTVKAAGLHLEREFLLVSHPRRTLSPLARRAMEYLRSSGAG